MSQLSKGVRWPAPARAAVEVPPATSFRLPRGPVEADGRQVARQLAQLHAELRQKQGPSRDYWPVLFDHAYDILCDRPCPATLEQTFLCLKEMKARWDAPAWYQFADVDSLGHPIREFFHQDPFTRRSFDKPRGYAGDAVMLDYIYGLRPAEPGTTELGRHIFNFTTNVPAAQSVRSRRDVLARFIDETAERVASPNVLAIACGHLREATESRAIVEGRVGQFTALDQDAESLELIAANHPQAMVRTVQASVKGIIAGRVKFTGQDLVYAAGLYDYLSERTAARLTRQMFDMLAPGGRVLVANFAPCLRDIGYMESYAGWRLIYRDANEMRLLSAEVPKNEVAAERVFWDEHGNIVFLELTKS